MNFHIFKLDLEKAEEPLIKLPTSAGSWKKQESFKKKEKFYFCFIDYAKAFDSVDKNKLWKILKEMGILTLPATCEICIQVKKQQLEPWNNRLFPNWERSTSRMYIAYLTYMQNTS